MSALIRNPDVAKVCFTGSVNGGKKMMEMASASLTRVTLELGGNDAAIILKDAIIDDVHLDRLFAAIYDTTGQICMNAKRLFVHKSRVDEVVKGLSARLEKVKLGYGLDKGTTMGPLHSPAQKSFVDSLIKEAKESGAKVLEFGELPGGDMKGGNFVRPAIVVNPKLTLRVVTEEQFGPVIPVIPFETEEDAVRMANDTWAGLAGSVWTADRQDGQSRRRPDGLRLRVGERSRRHAPRPARALRRDEVVRHRPRAGNRRRPRLPGYALHCPSRRGGAGRNGALRSVRLIASSPSRGTGDQDAASQALPQSSRVASRAPSTNVRSLAHMIVGCTR